jgi:predicted aconitase
MLLTAALLFLIAGVKPESNQALKPVPNRCSSAAASAAADALASKFDDHQFIFIGSTHCDLKIEQVLMCLVLARPFSSGPQRSSSSGQVQASND